MIWVAGGTVVPWKNINDVPVHNSTSPDSLCKLLWSGKFVSSALILCGQFHVVLRFLTRQLNAVSKHVAPRSTQFYAHGENFRILGTKMSTCGATTPDRGIWIDDRRGQRCSNTKYGVHSRAHGATFIGCFQGCGDANSSLANKLTQTYQPQLKSTREIEKYNWWTYNTKILAAKNRNPNVRSRIARYFVRILANGP